LNLLSPYTEISKEVKARLLFLLEVRPSVDYHCKVIQVDIKQMQRDREGNVSDTGSHHMLTDSVKGDDDSEVLEPLEI